MDPDQQFFENYGCGSERNYTNYCNAEFKSVAPPLLEAALRRRYGLRLDQ